MAYTGYQDGGEIDPLSATPPLPEQVGLQLPDQAAPFAEPGAFAQTGYGASEPEGPGEAQTDPNEPQELEEQPPKQPKAPKFKIGKKSGRRGGRRGGRRRRTGFAEGGSVGESDLAWLDKTAPLNKLAKAAADNSEPGEVEDRRNEAGPSSLRGLRGRALNFWDNATSWEPPESVDKNSMAGRAGYNDVGRRGYEDGGEVDTSGTGYGQLDQTSYNDSALREDERKREQQLQREYDAREAVDFARNQYALHDQPTGYGDENRTRSLAAYISGAGAHEPEDFHRYLEDIKAQNPDISESEAVLRGAGDRSLPIEERAKFVMGAHNISRALNGMAQGAHEHGDIDGSIALQERAHNFIADGTDIKYNRRPDGNIDVSLGETGRPEVGRRNYTIGPDAYRDHLIGQTTDPDHVHDNGMDAHMRGFAERSQPRETMTDETPDEVKAGQQYARSSYGEQAYPSQSGRYQGGRRNAPVPKEEAPKGGGEPTTLWRNPQTNRNETYRFSPERDAFVREEAAPSSEQERPPQETPAQRVTGYARAGQGAPRETAEEKTTGYARAGMGVAEQQAEAARPVPAAKQPQQTPIPTVDDLNALRKLGYKEGSPEELQALRERHAHDAVRWQPGDKYYNPKTGQYDSNVPPPPVDNSGTRERNVAPPGYYAHKTIDRSYGPSTERVISEKTSTSKKGTTTSRSSTPHTVPGYVDRAAQEANQQETKADELRYQAEMGMGRGGKSGGAGLTTQLASDYRAYKARLDKIEDPKAREAERDPALESVYAGHLRQELRAQGKSDAEIEALFAKPKPPEEGGSSWNPLNWFGGGKKEAAPQQAWTPPPGSHRSPSTGHIRTPTGEIYSADGHRLY